MAKAIYRNKRTDNEVVILKRAGGFRGEDLHVQYITSGRQAWYHKKDFDELFEFSRIEY